MKASVTVKGLEPLMKAFVLAGQDAPRFAAKALIEEAEEAFVLSSYVVPVRTGVLLASGEVSGPEVVGNKAYAYITYGGPAAPYATFVHELPPSRARHDPPTRWKFLENPVRLYAEGMAERMTVRVMNMIARRFDN